MGQMEQCSAKTAQGGVTNTPFLVSINQFKQLRAGAHATRIQSKTNSKTAILLLGFFQVFRPKQMPAS
jgi:hypothetical protein